MKLRFDVNKNVLKRIDNEIIVSYSRNKDSCFFSFSKQWSDIYKYALFTDVTGKQYIVDLGLGLKTKCIIPEEALKGNFFRISVFGDDRYTTTSETILIKPSGFTDKTEKAIEYGESTVSYTSNIVDTNRIDDYPKTRKNRFEISEHPY